MDAFLQVFGSLKVATIVLVIASLVFLLKIYKVIEKYFEKKYRMKLEQEKQFDIILKQVEQYPKWRQQSLDRQEEFTRAISALQESQKEITQELKQIEERRMKTERNKLRDRLLQSFRYYTSKEKNPLLAWSEMEADAFWKMFGDYESVDGDGHMHTEVQPAMRLLEIVPMHETERVTELMQSRK